MGLVSVSLTANLEEDLNLGFLLYFFMTDFKMSQ